MYINTGIVRFVYRDLPINTHRSALLAAVAGRCAARQDRFWAMHDRLFASHGEEWGGVPKRDAAVMVELAGELGLDIPKFEGCLRDPAVEQAARAEGSEAIQAGITSTPAFIINGRLLLGARPFEVFERAIKITRSRQ